MRVIALVRATARLPSFLELNCGGQFKFLDVIVDQGNQASG